MKLTFSKKPEDFIIQLVDSKTQIAKNYMEYNGRLIAFWETFPEGKIVCEHKYNIDTSKHEVKAYVCANRTDAREDCIADAYAERTDIDDTSLAKAVTAAKNAALRDAGFGAEYTSGTNEDSDDIELLAQHGVLRKELLGDTTKETVVKEDKKDVVAPATTEKGSAPKKRGRKPKVTASAEVVKEDTDTTDASEPLAETTEDVTSKVEIVKSEEVLTPETAPMPPEAEEKPVVVEAESTTIDIENMTLDEALELQIQFGQKKGQFMGEVDPSVIDFYAKRYTGPYQDVKRAAQIILAANSK